MIYPWTIVRCASPGLTVQGFYKDVIHPQMVKSVGEICESLEGAYLGNSKKKLDRIDLTLPLDETVALFGHF